MKNLSQYINEKLVINKNSTHFKYHPETKSELIEIIKAEVKKNGWECDLNHIDVSRITDMSYLFSSHKVSGFGLSDFNGDISEWDVSNVTNMRGMFLGAYLFNQHIMDWDVSNVTNMAGMFQHSTSFNQPISNWDVSGVEFMHNMFSFAKSFNQDLSKWKINNKCNVTDMFWDCNIKEEYKPNGIK